MRHDSHEKGKREEIVSSSFYTLFDPLDCYHFIISPLSPLPVGVTYMSVNDGFKFSYSHLPYSFSLAFFSSEL